MHRPCQPSLYSNSEDAYILLCYYAGPADLTASQSANNISSHSTSNYFVFVGSTGPEMKFQPEVVARSDCRLLLAV